MLGAVIAHTHVVSLQRRTSHRTAVAGQHRVALIEPAATEDTSKLRPVTLLKLYMDMLCPSKPACEHTGHQRGATACEHHPGSLQNLLTPCLVQLIMLDAAETHPHPPEEELSAASATHRKLPPQQPVYIAVVMQPTGQPTC